jgi:xanthine dehydrogenase accessory factor
MNKKLAVWQLIKVSLQNDIPVMLLYVLESKGSSPGRQGFFMAVTADGKMQGSIGGGIMEHKFVEMAKEKLQAASIQLQAGQVRKQIHDKSAAKNQSGMICSGEQTVFIYPVHLKEQVAVDRIISAFVANKTATLELSPLGISFYDEEIDRPFLYSMQDEHTWTYKERIGYLNHLYIVGGGHCALALSRLMSTMDFFIHLFDDREDLLTMQQNEFVHDKKLINSFEGLTSLIPSGQNNYVVLMTVGYRTDDISLRALAEKKFKYLGVLGSQKKIEKMFTDYRQEGMDEAFLQSIHAPIGLSIKSETPEEIAVSIAAEIIRVKNTDA